MNNIAIQCLLRPALTVVERCADYKNFRATIERIDRLLIDSEVESQAIELAFYGGYTHQEISEDVQLPLGTVKSRIRMGMEKLRDLLIQQEAKV